MCLTAPGVSAQFEEIQLDNTITDVQPMTGIIFWDNSGYSDTDVISLEFSYMLFNDIVDENGDYDWQVTEDKLDDIASRNHQAVLRFRYIYPGYETSVPDYIKNLPDYNETLAKSEGLDTWFADWTHPELERFTLEFYTRFAERYDNDPRLAFVEVGFGLWAEYHIYQGPNEIGVNFPSKAFQEEFFFNLDSNFINIPWMISIDAANGYYSPFEEKPELKEIKFGVFDDSFMHQNHAGYNTSSWNFFDRERYRTSPAGGEFSYYSSYDQRHVLDYPEGPYGIPYETFARDFHITFMIGSDQPHYQTWGRIKEASMASGYKFQIVSLKTTADSSVFEIMNYGIAPIYYDAYITVNGIRSPASLKLLSPGETITYSVSAGAKDADITIECDKLLEGQEIQFYGTKELGNQDKILREHSLSLPYPNPVGKGETVYLNGTMGGDDVHYFVYDSIGKLVLTGWSGPGIIAIPTSGLDFGLYVLKVRQNHSVTTNRFLII